MGRPAPGPDTESAGDAERRAWALTGPPSVVGSLSALALQQAIDMIVTSSTRRPAWLVPAMLAGLSVAPAVAGAARLVELAGDADATAANARSVGRIDTT